MTFAEIIHPITITEFFEEYYEKKELHIKRKDANYYHRFLSLEEIDGYVQLKQTYSPNVKLAYQGEEISPLVYSKELTSIGAYQSDKDKLMNHFDKGYTIKYDKLHQTYPQLASKVSGLEQELGICIRTSLYISPKETQGYGVHTDRHDVLALQLNGTKFWKVKMSNQSLPSVYNTPISVDWEAMDEVKTYEINSGDFFYCPRGLAHDVYTKSKSSTHFTLGFKPVYQYEVLNELSSVAYEKNNLRKAIPNNYASDADRKEFAIQFKKDLHALIDEMDANSIIDRSVEKMQAKQLGIQSNVFLNRFYEPSIEDQYVVKDKDSWRLEKQPMCVELRKGNLKYNLPLQAFPTIEKLFIGEKLSLKDLDFGVEKNQSLKLLKRLVSIHFLTRLS